MIADSIARLKVTLNGVEPQVLRRIEVPLNIRLDRLHLTLQAALGWTNSHLYEISAGGVGWGMVDPEWDDGPLDARKTRLHQVLADVGCRTLRYLYDFGDSWEHVIKIERITDAIPGALYPRLLQASGCCPPEDVGGTTGYQEFLAAIANPHHEEHFQCIRWIGGHFNPHNVDVLRINDELEALARKWSRKPTPKTKSIKSIS